MYVIVRGCSYRGTKDEIKIALQHSRYAIVFQYVGHIGLIENNENMNDV